MPCCNRYDIDLSETLNTSEELAQVCDAVAPICFDCPLTLCGALQLSTNLAYKLSVDHPGVASPTIEAPITAHS